MSQIGETPGSSSSFSPEEVEQYQKDYQKSFELFKNAFQEYDKPNLEPHKKNRLKDVMDEALQIMNQVASVALKKGQQTYEVQLEKNYQAFIGDPTTENRELLVKSIKALE